MKEIWIRDEEDGEWFLHKENEPGDNLTTQDGIAIVLFIFLFLVAIILGT